MREILFRGKIVNTYEWVEGNLITSAAYPDRAWIAESKTFFDKQLQNVGIVEVDPATVGQYTGVTDHNEMRMFEGDIVKVTNFKIMKSEGREVAKEPFNLKVLFFSGSFMFSTEEDIKIEFGLNTNEYAIGKKDKDNYKIEVIGNIHENFNLVEKGTPLADRFWGIRA